MVAYGFQKQFALKVEAGDKLQTIRVNGKRRHARPGEALQLYTGMRTKFCRKLVASDPICIDSLPVEITGSSSIQVNGVNLSAADRELLAIADGFDSWEEMFQWFQKTHGIPFIGTLIKWRLGGACSVTERQEEAIA